MIFQINENVKVGSLQEVVAIKFVFSVNYMQTTLFQCIQVN